MGNNTKMDSNKPAHVVRHKALSVSIWAREHEKKTFYNLVPQRAFTQDDGQTWEYTSSLSAEDGPVMAQLLNQAFAWVTTQTTR